MDDASIPRDMRGLSPRGRGKQRRPRFVAPLSGSIPAWAGETDGVIVMPEGVEVYPRVGGGNMQLGQMLSQATGLSPRGRGKLAAP